MKNLAILQARMTSSRLPGKVMMPINNKPMIHWQISRLSHSSAIGKLVVATSTDPSDDILASYLQEKSINVHRGSLVNVYQRFLDVINQNPDSEVIIRLTGDCPLVMPKLIDEMLEYYSENKFDYLSNCLTPSFPDGLDIEIFSRQSFTSLLTFTLDNKDLEHVTLKYRDPKADFRIGEFKSQADLGNERWTVDYPEDFEFVKRIFTFFKGKESTFDLNDILRALDLHPSLRNTLSPQLRNISLKEGADD